MQRLKNCKKCGAQMDASAKACPQCGAPVKSKLGWIIAGVVLVAIVIPTASKGSGGSSGSSSAVSSQAEASSAVEQVSSNESAKSESVQSNSAKTDSSKAVSSAESSQAESAVSQEEDSRIYRVGDTLDTGTLKITLQSVGDYTSDNMFIQPEEGNKFIAAYFVLENTGKTDNFTGGVDFSCYADDAVMDNAYISDKSLSSGSISPGRKTEGYVYYEVPVNAQKIEIEYETSWWKNEKAIFIVKE